MKSALMWVSGFGIGTTITCGVGWLAGRTNSHLELVFVPMFLLVILNTAVAMAWPARDANDA